jgi:hypothetical protein
MQVSINQDVVKLDKYAGPNRFKPAPKLFADKFGADYALKLDGEILPVRVSTGAALSGNRTPYFYVYIYLDGVSYSFAKDFAPENGVELKRVIAASTAEAPAPKAPKAPKAPEAAKGKNKAPRAPKAKV